MESPEKQIDPVKLEEFKAARTKLGDEYSVTILGKIEREFAEKKEIIETEMEEKMQKIIEENRVQTDKAHDEYERQFAELVKQYDVKEWLEANS